MKLSSAFLRVPLNCALLLLSSVSLFRRLATIHYSNILKFIMPLFRCSCFIPLIRRFNDYKWTMESGAEFLICSQLSKPVSNLADQQQPKISDICCPPQEKSLRFIRWMHEYQCANAVSGHRLCKTGMILLSSRILFKLQNRKSNCFGIKNESLLTIMCTKKYMHFNIKLSKLLLWYWVRDLSHKFAENTLDYKYNTCGTYLFNDEHYNANS